MTIRYSGPTLGHAVADAGFTMSGANTDPKNPPAEPTRQDSGPVLHRDPRYPPMVQNGLSGSFDHAKKLHSPDFLGSSSGYMSPVPKWAIGPFPTKAPGTQFRGGSGGHGFNRRTASVRVMDANWNQGMRTVYENDAGQVVEPKTGKTDKVKGHFPHDKKLK